MGKLVISISFAVVLCGCATEQNKDNPIVSPDVIQSVDAGSDEPQIPHYEPLWYKEVR